VSKRPEPGVRIRCSPGSTTILPVDGGDFELWQTFDRCYCHAPFHPTDPNLILHHEPHLGQLGFEQCAARLCDGQVAALSV